MYSVSHKRPATAKQFHKDSELSSTVSALLTRAIVAHISLMLNLALSSKAHEDRHARICEAL